MATQPNAVLKIKGIQSTANPVEITPADGYHAVIKGGAIGSLWADTRTSGALSSDYSQFRLFRAGVAKWRHGNNLDGTGNDKWSLYSDVASAAAITVNPSTLVADFAATPTVGGSPITGSPGGSTTQIQYNNGGAFSGASGIIYNNSNGYVGIGGAVAAGSLDAVFHVEKSVAGVKAAFINNTSATGYGLKVQTGVNTNYALAASDTAGTRVFQVFGKRVVQVGAESSTLLTDILTSTATVLHLEGDSTYIQPALYLTDGYATGGGNKVTSMLYMSGSDFGLRLGYNYREPYTSGGTISYCDSSLPQNQISLEQGGSLGLAYTKPAATTAGTYDSEGGKDFIVWPQGFYSSDGKRIEHVMVACGNRNRGLEFGVRNDTSGSSDYVARIRIRSRNADNTNPIYLWVGGSLKQVTEGAADSGGSGYKVLRVPN